MGSQIKLHRFLPWVIEVKDHTLSRNRPVGVHNSLELFSAELSFSCGALTESAAVPDGHVCRGGA